MSSPNKEGTDPNIMHDSALRKRNTPASASPGKLQRKRRMSMKKDRRRVSFAPDPELTMIHTFEKDDDNSTGLPSPAVFEKIDEGEPLADSAPMPIGSPIVQDMDITQAVPMPHVENNSALAWDAPGPGEITAALPSLGDLAEADELEAAAAISPINQNNNNITGSLPGLSDLLREEEMEILGAAPTPGSQVAPPSVSPSTGGVGQTGQANKWGFVPGDDDTMDLDLKGHGRLIMGDRTYNKMYLDNMTGTTARGLSPTPTEHTTGSMAVVMEEEPHTDGNATGTVQQQDVAVAADPGDDEPVSFGAGPNWNAPAFLPPYLGGGELGGDHPALHQSPDVTNSSMNTMSTRRVSVDARRHSVSSRRFSVADGGTGGLLGGLISPAAPISEGGTGQLPQGDGGEEGDDDTGDLLADDAGGEAPGSAAGGLTLPHNFAGAALLGGAATKTPGFGAASVGRADSSRDPNTATAGLLRTGGTTDLLQDTLHQGGEGPHTAGTHGTTRLLQMDITANSAIGAKLLSHAAPSPIQEDGAALVGSPNLSGAPKMSHSPPHSAMNSGSVGRRGSMHHASPMVSGGNGAPHSARSGMGATPGTHRLARTPGSGMAIVPVGAAAGPGTGPGGAGAAAWGPPGSAIAARYPGSAVATGRLSQGFTPSTLPAITFQDFAKVVEVQFLDNLRRGASINYADLQPNPVPVNLSEAYTLLCITSPNVAELETAIHTLQSETARLRGSAADLEVMLGQANPPIFRHVQTASYEQLEALRSNVAALKKVCRAKALALLKDVRCQMEESKAGRLARAAEGLRVDLGFVKEHAAHTEGVADAAERYAVEARAQLAKRAEERAVDADHRRRTAAARAALSDARVANEERRRRLEATSARVTELRKEREALAAERAQAQAAAAELRTALAKLSTSVGSGNTDGSDPHAVLAQLKAVASLERCLGVKVERTGRDAAGSSALVLQVGPLFRLRVTATPAGVRGTVELVAADAAGRRAASADALARRSLAAAVAGCSAAGGDAFFVDGPSAPAALQATVARLQRSSDLAEELHGVRIGCRHLTEVSAAPGGGLRVLFSGMDACIRFEVTLTPGPAYPLGALPHETKIWYDGNGQVTSADVSEAVCKAPAGPGRIRAVCSELSSLVERAAPAGGSHAAYRTNFGNPLFGSAAAAMAQAPSPAEMPTPMEVTLQA